ncbi:MAG: NDP-sugar synthase [Sandaracinaceae bacterium]|nr:NDP-sugar synthase [Sandaracinaceae bacterium]
MLGMVFAAGLGTRLRPLTDALPKPAVPLLNRPLASYSLERLAALGITRVAVNTHHLGEEVRAALSRHVPRGLEVRFVHEPELLGTGGGLRNGWEALGAGEPIVVMNGDILFWPDLEGALALHEELDAVATVVLRPDARARQLGALGVDGAGRVRQLLGRPEASAPLRELMFTGVHVLSARALADLPERGCIIRTSYRRWVDEGETVGGFVDEGAWRDLGTPAEYLRASLDLLRGELRWPGLAPPPGGVLVGQGAEVEGASLSEVVVGEGARVAPGVRLERAVVWPGTQVLEGASDAILAPHARVAG